MEMSSKKSLKHTLLARLFGPSTLLKSSCNSSSSSPSTTFTHSANTGSTRSLSSFTTDDPLLLDPGKSSGANISSKLDRAYSLSSSSRMLSLNCNACRPTKALEDDVVAAVTMKKERRMNENSEFYETGEREGRTCPHASPSSPSKNYYHLDNTHEDNEVHKKKDVKKKAVKKKKKKKKKFFTNAYGFSSSTDNDDVGDENGSDQLFSSDETEAFFSSRSFSSDSSEFYKSSRKKKRCNNRKVRKQRSKIAAKVYDGFKPIVSVVEQEKSTDGIPVIKRSRDPYVDFRDSMVEMIVERQIFGAKDLQKLLHSYLSLNSPLHHAVIIRAFADISEVLFCH